jgi:hypothetical protein
LNPETDAQIGVYSFGSEKGFQMPDKEETRLRAAVRDCRRSSFAASYTLTHAVRSVVNDHDAYRKLLKADATASEHYTAARMALKAYRTTKKLI